MNESNSLCCDHSQTVTHHTPIQTNQYTCTPLHPFYRTSSIKYWHYYNWTCYQYSSTKFAMLSSSMGLSAILHQLFQHWCLLPLYTPVLFVFQLWSNISMVSSIWTPLVMTCLMAACRKSSWYRPLFLSLSFSCHCGCTWAKELRVPLCLVFWVVFEA